jgi:hypothetical protein
MVKDQVHIRNAEAAQLARTLAQQTGRTLSEVVLDALRQYRPARRGRVPHGIVKDWKRLLRQDRKGARKQPEIPIEAFYDKSTGLPA